MVRQIAPYFHDAPQTLLHTLQICGLSMIQPVSPLFTRYDEPAEDNIHELVHVFYDRVRDDPLLGPIFGSMLAGRWESHLPKMCAFWSGVVLGTEGYRGNLQHAHQPLAGLEPQHFTRWLQLFLETVESRYEPAAAARFMEPALRIAQSLQLSRFGWNHALPAEQQTLFDRFVPRQRPASRRGEAFPAKIIGHQTTGNT